MLMRLSYLLTLLLAVGGCDTTYRDAKRFVEPGGQGDREIQQRSEELARERALQQQRRDQLTRNNAELQSIQTQTQKAESELRVQGRQLEEALRAGKVTRQQHTALSTEIAKIQSELRTLEQQNQEAGKTGNSPEVSARSKRKLAELEERKKALERTLSQFNAVR